MQSIPLTANWQLKERNPTQTLPDDFASGHFASAEGWLPATAPGVVQLDLLAAGRIPDPFYGLNENKVQWVGERDWLYRCAFVVSPDALGHARLDLCCDGLDTFATVWLNGE